MDMDRKAEMLDQCRYISGNIDHLLKDVLSSPVNIVSFVNLTRAKTMLWKDKRCIISEEQKRLCDAIIDECICFNHHMLNRKDTNRATEVYASFAKVVKLLSELRSLMIRTINELLQQ